MDQLTSVIVSTLNQLIEERDFEFPVRFAVIGVNGSLLYGAYEMQDSGEVETDIHVEFNSEKGIAVPVNIIFVDATGKAARLAIEKEDQMPTTIH